MQSAHPLAVTSGQIIVHGDDVDAFSGQCVQVHRQGRHQGLAFTGLHFGNPAKVEGHATHELYVEVPLTKNALCSFSNDGVGLNEKVVQGFAFVKAGTELHRLGGEFGVAECHHLVFKIVDERDNLCKAANLLAFTGAQDF